MSCKILGFPDFPRVNFSAPNFSCGAGLKVICLFGLVFKFWNTGERNSGFFSFPRLQETVSKLFAVCKLNKYTFVPHARSASCSSFRTPASTGP